MPNDSTPDGRIDLSALDPFREGPSLDARAAVIARDAMDARQRRVASALSRQMSIAGALMAYATPTMIAAGIVFAIALSAVARAPAPSAAQVSAADVMGIPRRLTGILGSPGAPSLVDLGAALDVSSSR